MPTKKPENGAQGYGASYEELQNILAALEQGEIDVDDLSAKVKRAAELIESCQKRLKDAEVEVKRVVEKFQDKLDEDDGDGSGG
jgi:exodeoxyribonuclease VII small subunit